MAGKGDSPRPVNKDKYDRNYIRIFRKNKESSKNNTMHNKKQRIY